MKPRSEMRYLEINDIDHELAKLLYDESTKRAVQHDDFDYKISTELMKFLFTANAGAAVGLFLELKSAPKITYLIGFLVFCLGAGFVGLSNYLSSIWGVNLVEGWTKDHNAFFSNEITLGTLNANNRKRHASKTKQYARRSLTWAFMCLITGALISAIPFYVACFGKK
jgi:hypothetical protein